MLLSLLTPKALSRWLSDQTGHFTRMAALRKLTSWRSPGLKSDELIIWSKQGVLELKEKVKVKASRMFPHQEPPRVLFIGETGSGKSSYISSVMSALSGDVTYSAMIGEKQGSEENTSKRYLEYRVFMGEEKEPLNFILCDARGLGKMNQLGMSDGEIERLMDGKLRHNDLIESEKGSDGTLIDNRDPRPPSCVVFAQTASRLGELDRHVQDKLNKAADIARGRGIPCSVVLTHIDMVKPTVTKKLHTALHSRTLQERVQRAAKEVGVNTNRVFLVKNYTTEERTHVRHDILILRALHGILVDVSARHRFAAVAESRPTPLNRYSGPDKFDSYQHAPMSRRSLDESHSSSDSMVMSMADSGPNTSVSMVGSPHLQNTQYHHQRFSSDRTKGMDFSSPASYKNAQLTEETTPKAKWTQGEKRRTSQLMKRGEDFVEYYIPKNRPRQKNYEGSDSDVEYDPEEDGSVSDKGEQPADSDSDEGMGHSYTSSSDEEYGDSCGSLLKNTIKVLGERQFPEHYREEANLQGAKPLYQPTILQQNHSSVVSTDTDAKLSLQLPKTFTGEGVFHKRVYETLQEMCGEGSGSLWMSYTLPADLGLPLDALPPPSTDLQVFFLAPDHPPFLLTFFDPAKIHRQSEDGEDFLDRQLQAMSLEEPMGVREEITLPNALGGEMNPQNSLSKADRLNFLGGMSQTSGSEADRLTAEVEKERKSEAEQVRLYTLQLGKFLTTALLDFCCCDFVLLPCCLSLEDFALPHLQKELQQQLGLARRFYGSPLDLSPSAYPELKAAAVAVTGVSHVPRLMSSYGQQDTGQGRAEDQRLVLMDPDWRAAVSLLVETLTDHNDYSELMYPARCRFKTQVAVVEAAMRLSFTDHVLLLTASPRLQHVCRELTKQVFYDMGVTLKLTALPPGGGDDTRPTYVILLDCPPGFEWYEPDCIVLRVSQATGAGEGEGGPASPSTTTTRHLIKDWV